MTSREIDAAIAEKIMGWYSLKESTNTFGNTTYYGLTFQDDARGGYEIPYYSSSISAGLEVVEKMRELGWYFEGANHEPDAIGPWLASFTTNDATDSIDVVGSSLPYCICLAALKALGVTVES